MPRQRVRATLGAALAAAVLLAVAPGHSPAVADVAAMNEFPRAVLTAAPRSGPAPLWVRFDASGSWDPDGSVTTWAWNFGDGTTGSGPVVWHAYDRAGLRLAGVTVTDDKGASAAAFTIIAVTAGTGSPLPGVGWGIYSHHGEATASPSVVPAMDRERPTMIRWLVEIDRYLVSGPRVVDWSAYDAFLQRVRDLGAHLQISLSARDLCWSGVGANPFFGWCPNAGLIMNGWAADNLRLWFKDPAVSYRPFVEGLVDKALAFVPPERLTVSPWNEPDQRFTLWGNRANYADPWVNFTTYGLDNSRWTGGYRHLTPLYDTVASVLAARTGGRARVASGGIVHDGWRAATASRTELLEIHAYLIGSGADAGAVLANVEAQLLAWQALRPGLPFLVGETGIDGYSARQITPTEAGYLRTVHDELSRRYQGRYLGMALHSGAPSFAPSPAWWNSGYDGT